MLTFKYGATQENLLCRPECWTVGVGLLTVREVRKAQKRQHYFEANSKMVWWPGK